MADIKQAAKWMREGKLVRRGSWAPLHYWKSKRERYPVQLINAAHGKQDALFGTDDLLAEDWEVAQ